MELRQYLDILARRWWLFLLPLLGTVALTLLLTSRQPDVYESTTTLVVAPVEDEAGTKATDILIRAAEITPTFARVAQSDVVELAARANLEAAGIDTSGLGKVKVKSEAVTGTTLLRLKAIGPEPDDLAPFLAEVAEETIIKVDSLNFVFTLSALDPPEVPESPEDRNTALSLALGIFLGAVLGGILVFFTEYLAAPEPEGREMNIFESDLPTYNEAYFKLRFDAELGRARRIGDVFSVGMIKLLPRSEGRGKKPDLEREDLLAVALVLGELCRAEDFVSHVDDDTFLLMLPQMSYAIAKDVVAEIPLLLWPATGGEAPPLTRYDLSVGVCEYGADEVVRELPRVAAQ